MSLVPATSVPVEGMSEKAQGTLSPRPALALLCALLVIDFADRQVVVTAFPYLRAEFGVGMAQLAPFVERLPPDARTQLVADAVARLGADHPPLVRSILVMVART